MPVRPEAWTPQGITSLEPRAWEALKLTDKNVCVSAGAGSGKTEFLAQKATYLLQTGICTHPKRILAISFKRDAARNLEERVEKRCPREQARRFGSMTFDGFTKQFLDRFRKAIPAHFCPPSNYRIVFPSHTELESFLERHGFTGLNSTVLQQAIATTSLPFEGVSSSPQKAKAVRQYWREQYESHQEVWLTFPMINRLVEWLLRENEVIRHAVQLTYPYVFIDEFQDTTYPQYELLKTAFQGSGTFFTVVGDDKQRIMGWAGAMPDAFPRFKDEFLAHPVSLLSNWRSHEALVRIQHVVASKINPSTEYPSAKAERSVDGDVSAIWEFKSNQEESDFLTQWLLRELNAKTVEPHDIAILVRLRADKVEKQLMNSFTSRGIKVRNVARNVGDIAIQDLLGEYLTSVILPLLRLGATQRSPNEWTTALKNIQLLEGVDPDNEGEQSRLQVRLQTFIRHLRGIMKSGVSAESVHLVTKTVLEFVGESTLRHCFVEYQRKMDFERVWSGLVALLLESVEGNSSWQSLLDSFQGFGQIALMTIHKSKGLEFHTMIFYGLDNQTWWSLTPDKKEELNSFFVALTRAKQRAFFTLCTERGQPVTWVEDLIAPAGVERIDGTTI